MKMITVAVLLISTTCFAELKCDLKSISTGQILETDRTNGGIVIARSLSSNKYLYAFYSYGDENESAGFMAAIYDTSAQSAQNPTAKLVAGSFGHKTGEPFSIQDKSLDLTVDCVAQ